MGERADALVMFGLTGDLGEQKLFPALVELARAGRLGVPVVGVGRSERTDEEVIERLAEAARELDASDVVDEIDLRYVAGDATDPDLYERLAERLDGARLPVLYAAVPPDLFGDVAERLAASPLPGRTRLVVEKPFGRDAEHAQQLHARIVRHVPDERLFIVDHFLAKAAVENLLTFRCANPMIDALMRQPHVERIEITMAEEFGVDGRGSFYDPVGAVADVVQNHLLQLVAVMTMEPPADGSDDAFDSARADLLSAVRPLDPGDVVLGQYEGYTELDDVADESGTETFVAARLAIDTERWRDVPVLIRAGKRMARTVTEAIVVVGGGATPNRIRFRLKPGTVIEIELGVLDADDHGVRPERMIACAPDGHGALGDYATMLDDALDGSRRHFADIRDVVAAWRIVDPVRTDGVRPEPYRPGTDGPESADRLAGPDGWVAPAS